jgi:predicted nucleotidyltransferase
MKPEMVIEAFCTWARQRPDIAGVFLVGSHARGDATSDSDIDLVILTSEPEPYLDDVSWVSQFGTARSVDREDWGKVQSLRVFYAGGPEVEYGITTPDWASHPVPQRTQEVLAGGMKLLFDRTGVFADAIKRIPN